MDSDEFLWMYEVERSIVRAKFVALDEACFGNQLHAEHKRRIFLDPFILWTYALNFVHSCALWFRRYEIIPHNIEIQITVFVFWFNILRKFLSGLVPTPFVTQNTNIPTFISYKTR
jgi:hypothetical protein